MTEDLQARIAQEKEETIQGWITHIDQSVEKALRGESQLTEKELAIRGFSTPTQRSLWNYLMSNAAMYVESGVYGGGTFFSAIKGNKDLTAVGIDDFSQDFSQADIFDHFRENLEQYKDEAHSVKFINDDFFSMDLDSHFGKDLFGDVDFYFYDAVHTPEAQGVALPRMLPYMRDVSIFGCDDWQWLDAVERPTRESLGVLQREGKIKVHKEWVVSDGIPDSPITHNGFAFFLIEKL